MQPRGETTRRTPAIVVVDDHASTAEALSKVAADLLECAEGELHHVDRKSQLTSQNARRVVRDSSSQTG